MLALLAVLVVYTAVVCLRVKPLPRRGLSLVIPVVGTAGLLVRGAFDETSVEGSLRASGVLLLAVLALTGGEPDVLLDRPGMKAKARRQLPKVERAELERRERRTAMSQLSFIAFVIVFALAVVLSPLGDAFD